MGTDCAVYRLQCLEIVSGACNRRGPGQWTPRKGRPAALAASPGGRREATQGESICPAKTQRCLAADLGQQLLFALALAQPARVVLARLGFIAQQV